MQKWKEKYGARSTYKMLAKLLYEAGKTNLVEAVFSLITQKSSTDISQLPQSAATSHAYRLQKTAVFRPCRRRPTGTFRVWRRRSTATSHACRRRRTTTSCPCRRQPASTSCICRPQPVISHVCSCCIILYLIIALPSILLTPYLSQSDNQNCFQSTCTNIGDDYTFGSELARCLYSQKTGKVAPNNLPDFPGPFVGRNQDVNKIIHLLLNPFVKTVHIFGLPAVGKSTLAVHVGYQMASHGVAVRYINVDESHMFKSFYRPVPSDSIKTQNKKPPRAMVNSKTFSNNALSWYSNTEKKFVSATAQGLIEWAKALSNSTLLILDNCDSLLQRKRGRNDVLLVFDALNKASPYLHIVTTSRLKLNLLDVELYKLKPLLNASAIRLLHLISPTINVNDSRAMNNLLDGIPLALKIVGSLVSEMRPPNIIIRELQQNLIQTLTPEDTRPETQKMRPVLRLSYNYLASGTQECALCLSNFPGSFSQDAAHQILSNCTNSAPTECLRNLSDMSLLDPYSYAGQSRFQFHKLIKEYLIDVKSNCSTVDISSVVSRFNFSFVIYYTQILSNFVNIYNESPHDEENIGRFEYESHNFEHLMEKVSLFDLWPVTAFVNLSHTLTCDLMLEVFSKLELLKVGQKVLVTFEGRMDDISTQFGAFETLNIYHDLVLALRESIHSFPQDYCVALCKETFLQQGFTTRIKIIDKYLAKTNHSRHDYYRKLQFPFFGESICFSYCLHFVNHDIRTVIMCTLAIVVFAIVKVIIGKCTFADILDLLEIEFWLCFSLFFHVSVSVSAYVVTFIGLKPNGLKMIKHRDLIVYLTLLYYVVLCILLIYAFREDMILTNFFFFCIISNVTNLFRTDVGIIILHILSIIFVANTYILDFATLRYATTYILAVLYYYWEYFRIILAYRIYFILLILFISSAFAT